MRSCVHCGAEVHAPEPFNLCHQCEQAEGERRHRQESKVKHARRRDRFNPDAVVFDDRGFPIGC